MTDGSMLKDDNLVWLFRWYYSHCDGDWEHGNGIEIATLDNPGWCLRVRLTETELVDKPFQEVQIDRSEHDWIRCFIENGIFEGVGGPLNLSEGLQVFRDWAENRRCCVSFMAKKPVIGNNLKDKILCALNGSPFKTVEDYMEGMCYQPTWEERKVRRLWLIFTLCNIFLLLLFCISSFALPKEDSLSTYAFYGFLGNTVGCLIYLLISWYCAYKKFGTRWLMFALIIGPWVLFFAMMVRMQGSYDVKAWVDFGFTVVLYAWWYILSLRLRKINKKIPAHKKVFPQYFESMQELDVLETVETLNKKAIELVEKWPQFASAIMQEYKLKKSRILMH